MDTSLIKELQSRYFQTYFMRENIDLLFYFTRTQAHVIKYA